MGRPKLEPEEKCSELLRTRVTEAEAEAIRAKAHARGWSVSAWIRWILIGSEPPSNKGS